MKLKIRRGRLSGVRGSPPGRIDDVSGRLLLSCGEGSYEILELQEEGKKPVAALDFLNGMRGRGIPLPLELKGVNE
jgi:methionyl-tRNA formyltransferase